MSRKPRDHVRLARAFDVPLTRVGTAVWTTGVMGLLGLAAPMFFIPAGGVALGHVGVAAADRRAIAKGLREVEAFGFPVEGYRDWLLADSPAFDIELARDVDLEILRPSVAAVDPAVSVDKKRERVFRFVMPRIGLPNTKPHLPPIEVGDRRSLMELHRRILAPLHADVRIVAMRMGDDRTLAALVPSRPADAPAVTDALALGAFRESAMAAPPALQALVQIGGDRALPHEARRLKLRDERVMHAANASPSGAGSVLAITFGGAMAAAQFGSIEGMAVGAVGGFIGGLAAVISGNRRAAKSVSRMFSTAGFPIEDYEDWLLSGRPLFDIETARPIPREWFLEQCAQLTAFSVTQGATVPWVEDVAWLSETEVRVETRPSYVQPPTSRIDPFYGGSHQMFRTFLWNVLSKLHAQCEIRAVRMGGFIDRRL